MDLNQTQGSSSYDSVDDVVTLVTKASRAIYSTIAFNADRTTAKMKLPTADECDSEILALAIERLFTQSFKLSIPNKVMMKLKVGASVKFSVKPKKELPPLAIIILLSSTNQLLSIQGSKPISGINGFSVLIFHWQQESGVFDSQGNVDLKKVNKLPGVKAGSLLAKIYMHTNGRPGINCFGKRLQQAAGIPIDIEWDDDSILRTDEVEETTEAATYQLYAKQGGIVQYSLRREKNPKTLCRITVMSTIVINGDVDYGVGDQGQIANPELGCESNIIVEGSVRGVFSIQSTGYIHVKKSIEGTVSANNVKTALITCGSSVTAKKKLTAGGIINATAKAETIIVTENTSSSSLHASDKVIFEVNSTCMSVKVNTNKALSKTTRFSGTNSFTLGKELFCAVEKHATKVKKLDKKITERSGPLKVMAETIVDHLALLNSITRKRLVKVEPEAVQILGVCRT